MFSITILSFARLDLLALFRQRSGTHQKSVDPEEMPESWRRDIGMLDGRDRRGAPKETALHAARMTYSHRNL